MNARPLALFSRTFSVFISLIVIAAAVSRLAGQTSAAPLTLLSREGRRTLNAATIDNREVVALDDLAAAFQLTVRQEAGAITVSYQGRTIVLTPEQSLASVERRLVSLPSPPVRANNRWFVPIEFINRALALVYDARLDVRRPSRLVVIGDIRVPRVTVRQETTAGSARITIDATPRTASTVAQDGPRLTIKFDADALDVTLPAVVAPPVAPVPSAPSTQAAPPAQTPPGQPAPPAPPAQTPPGPPAQTPPAQPAPPALITGIRVLDPVTLAIDLGPRFSAYKASSQSADASSRLIVDLVSATTDTATTTAAPLAPPSAPLSDFPLLGPPPPPLRTIFIDPGHGGEDAGARGAEAMEKDVTLAVARRLRATIEARLGIRVLLTRDDDRAVAIDDRAAMANNNKADLFISLHANAAPRPAVTGGSIYVAAFSEADRARASVAEARVPSVSGRPRELDLVLWDLAQTRFLDQSTDFARRLQSELQNRIALEMQTVDQAPFRVLESANMPAVLIEMGYLSNPDEEKKLTSGEFQSAFVQGVYDAVVGFRDALAGGDVVGAAAPGSAGSVAR